MVGFGAAQIDAVVTDFAVGIDGEEVKLAFLSERRNLAWGAHALDDGVFAFGLGALEELVGDVTR